MNNLEKVLAYKKNNQYISLFDNDNTGTPLTISDSYGWRVYQNTLELILLQAIKDLCGDISIEVVGSFNKGIYFEINDKFDEGDIDGVKEVMRMIIDTDEDITKDGNKYTLEDTTVEFLIPTANKTGVITLFDVKKYKRGLLLTYPHYLSVNELKRDKQTKLAKMFTDAKRDTIFYDCKTVDDLNKMVSDGNFTKLLGIQESVHQNNIDEIAKKIIKNNKRVVLICGPSSSGKTTFAKRLCLALETLKAKTLYMGTDDYYVEKEQMPKGKDGQNNYECIEALDVELFQENIKGLINGEIVDLPEFDFDSMHKVYGKNYKSITSDTILVIEGILTLNEKFSSTISDDTKFKIYISPVSPISVNKLDRLSNTDIRLARRICRDYRARNTKVERTIELWKKVREGEEENIFPFIDEANVVFNTYCIYEPLVLAKYIKPLLQSVNSESPYYCEAERLLKVYDLYTPASDFEESYIYNKSIIREFIGGSALVD